MEETTAAPATAYACPLTLEPIAEPVCSSVGSVYERAAFEMFTGDKDPCTGQELKRASKRRSWPVSLDEFQAHAAAGTVGSTLRRRLVRDFVEPDDVLLGISGTIVPRLLKLLARADSKEDIFAAAARIAMYLREHSVALDNIQFTAYLASDPDGKLLSTKIMTTSELHAGLSRFLVACLHRPNEMTDLRERIGSSGFCYNGNFGDPMSARALAALITDNRKSMLGLLARYIVE